ncbi:MAG: pseudouridine synthase [Aestuariibacter sp.]
MAILNYQPPTSPYIKIVYRDEDILLLDKPSGLLTVPGKAPEHKDSLQYRVQRVFPTATIVHRLDMATSGLLLMPLNRQSHKVLGQQFEKRLINKQYLARVAGVPAQPAGRVDLPLICDWPNRPKQKVDMAGGKSAQTDWQCLHSLADESLMLLKPITGRSHQLRVHMQSLGHTILGDRLYADEATKAKAPRLQLHATTIEFAHPSSGEQVKFTSPCPFLSHYNSCQFDFGAL